MYNGCQWIYTIVSKLLLIPALTQHSFQDTKLLFSQASEVTGKNLHNRMFVSSTYQTCHFHVTSQILYQTNSLKGFNVLILLHHDYFHHQPTHVEHKLLCMINPFPTQWHLLTSLGNKPFENFVGKGEIAGNEQFLLFLQCFLPIWITFCYFHQISNCHLKTLVWKSLKFVVW